jgi:adenylosuccinate synthase
MTTGIKNFTELPQNAQSYIKYISNFIGVPIKIISTGPGRDEIIQVK